jgi:octaprenyl-diphosphate synthase
MPDRSWEGLASSTQEWRAARDLVGADLARDDVLADLVGRLATEDLRLLRESERPRLRPLVVALSARAAGAARVEPEVQHAAELLHLALTLHDVTLGVPGGLRRRVARRVLRSLTTGHLSVRALEMLRHTGPADALLEAVDVLRAFADAESLTRAIHDRQTAASGPEVEDHADLYHGAVLTFCARSGAIMAGAPRTVVGTLGRFGRHLGRLWTFADDHAHLSGDHGAEHLLKRVRAGRPVLAVTAAIEKDPGLAPAWTRLARTGQFDDARTLLAAATSAGGLGATREAMVRASWSARQNLRELPESPYRNALEDLAVGLVRWPLTPTAAPNAGDLPRS